MRKILSINDLVHPGRAPGAPGTFEKVKIQTIVEDNLQSEKPGRPPHQFIQFLKQLASGTIFLSASDGSTPPNHLASTSSEYRMLIQESERENKL